MSLIFYFKTIFLFNLFLPFNSYADSSDGLCNLYLTKTKVDTSRSKRARFLDPNLRSEKILQIKNEVSSIVFGQNDIKEAAFELLDNAVFNVERGTSGNALFIGPTGVGKTLLAETLAKAIGGKLVKLVGGDFQESSDITSLTGSPPRWSGHGTTQPLLTPQIISSARGTKIGKTILLFDELEKVHVDILKWLLNLLDEGKSTVWIPNPADTNNETNRGSSAVEIDFSDVIFIGSANSGSAEVLAESKRAIDYAKENLPEIYSSAYSVSDLIPHLPSGVINKEPIIKAVKQSLKLPEFIGRIDAVEIAWPLLKKGMEQVFDREVQKILTSIKALKGFENIQLRVSDSAREYILSLADNELGARNVSKVVNQNIKSLLSRAIQSQQITGSDRVFITLNQNNRTPILELIAFSRIGSASETKAHELSYVRRAEENTPDFDSRIGKLSIENTVVNGTHDYLKRDDVEFGYDAIAALLFNLPKGNGWSFLKPSSTFYLNKVAELGGTRWATTDKEYLDLDIVFMALSKLNSKNLNQNQKQFLYKISWDIINQSLLKIGSKKAEFKKDLDNAIKLLLGLN